MSSKITIDENALLNAELILQAFLCEKVSGGNFRAGSHLNDVVIRAISYVYALIQSEVNSVRERQTLNLLSLSNDLSSDAAAEDLLSNWFITRKTGTQATGFLKVVLGPPESVPLTVTVPETTEFVSEGDVVFTPTATSEVTYLTKNMVTEVDAVTGLPIGVSFNIPVICSETGAAGNIDPGRMAGFDVFEPSVLFVESLNGFSSGTSDESTEEMIDRAKTAITSRGMLSLRSIDTYLRDTVTDLQEVVVIGAGDPEMRRDLVTDVAAGISVHSLGHVDIYCHLPLESGLEFPFDGTTVTLPARESNAVTLSTFTIVPTEANFFPVTQITSLREVSGDTAVVYTRVSYCTLANGNIAYLNRSNGVYVDSGSPTLTLSDNTYYVSYPSRDDVNTSTGAIQFTVPSSASAREFILQYDGVKSLSAVSAAVDDRQVRSVASDLRAYSFHPLLLSIQVPIYLRSDAPGTFPEEYAKETLTDFINTFDRSRTLTVSDITQYLLGTHSVYLAGVGVPVGVYYTLQTPDGKEVMYYTYDKVTVEDPTKQFDTSGAYSELTRVQQGVSDMTVRPLVRPESITFTLVS